MDSKLVARAISFHGQPLQKIWEGERGSDELPMLGLSKPDYSVYINRQRNLTFQDRAKRLKLHQFIARKASVLFSENLTENSTISSRRKDKNINGGCVILPPFESFIHKSYEKNEHLQHVLGNIKPGDIVYGQVINGSRSSATIRVICTGEPIIRYLVDAPIKAYLVAQNMIPFYDKKGGLKQLSSNDFVCCEVLEMSIDADRMNLGMKGTLTIDANAPLGIISADQLPEYYKKSIDNVDSSYGELLKESKAFLNPNYDEILFDELGLDTEENFTHMTYFKYRFPQQEYASELRQAQASKWAFRSVAQGIEHFKVGQHTEAFQCLNKALNIDPKNVEGLVARGALYANSGSFNKAVEDFETALKLYPYHANARKYMGETLVALGRSYEDENQLDKARKVYADCLKIIPNHEEAKSSLEFLNNKLASTSNDFMMAVESKMLTPELKFDPKKEKKSKNKKKKEKNKKRSSSTSGSEDTESSSGTTSNESSSKSSVSSSKAKKKKKYKNEKSGRQKSLSPLSKRMAKMDEDHPPTGTTRYQFNKPFHMLNAEAAEKELDYNAKVRNFLEMTQDDDDYEESVRKLLAEASAHKNMNKQNDGNIEKKKEKKKKEKKPKKEKKKKKDKNVKVDSIDKMDFKEALKIIKSLPAFELANDLQKLEKSIEEIHKHGIHSYNNDINTQPSYMTLPGTSSSMKIDERQANQSVISAFAQANKSPSPIKELGRISGTPQVQLLPKAPSPKPEIKPFAIRPPIVLDKFGCFRLAEPIETVNLNQTRKSRSRSRSRSRSGGRYRRYRSGSRSRSRSRGRYRDYRRSRSRSPRRWSPVRRRSPIRRYSPIRSPRFRRRSPSLSPRRRSVDRFRSSPMGRRSRSRSESPWGGPRGGNYRGGYRGRYVRNRRPFGGYRGRAPYRGGPRSPRFNRYSRSRSRSRSRSPSIDRNRRSPKRRSRSVETKKPEDRWAHDKYNDNGVEKGGESKSNENKTTENKSSEHKNPDIKSIEHKIVEDKERVNINTNDESVEEIEKAIFEAQKNRKEEIIQRDKDLLKKST